MCFWKLLIELDSIPRYYYCRIFGHRISVGQTVFIFLIRLNIDRRNLLLVCIIHFVHCSFLQYTNKTSLFLYFTDFITNTLFVLACCFGVIIFFRQLYVFINTDCNHLNFYLNIEEKHFSLFKLIFMRIVNFKNSL